MPGLVGGDAARPQRGTLTGAGVAAAPVQPQQAEAVRVLREFWRRMASNDFGQVDFWPEPFVAAPNRAQLVEPIE